MAGVPLLHLLAGRSPDAPEDEAWRSSKELFAKVVGYEVNWTPGPGIHARPEPEYHPVKLFHSSRARNIVTRAPIRTSKSWSAGWDCTHDLVPRIDPKTRRPVDDERTVWLVGTDYETLKEWEYLWGYLYPNDFELVRQMGGTVVQKYNTPASGNLRVVIEWGKAVSGRVAKSIAVGKSSKNETSLQGEEVLTACLSEGANHEERIVKRYLDGRCQRILIPTTPKRTAMWIHKRIEDGFAEEIVYTRECNPKYDWKRYEDALAKAIATWGSAEADLDFLEQFEGEWVFNSGKLIPFRWVAQAGLPSHVVDERDSRWTEIADWLRFAEWNVSMDYGFTDPAASHLWAVGPDGQKLIYGEVHARHLHNAAFIKKMNETYGKLLPPGAKIREWIPDPQKPEHTKLMAESGLKVWGGLPPKLHRDRTASFRALIEALSVDERTGQIPLLIHSRCTETIREWKNVRKKEGWSGDEFAHGAVEGDDDLLDSARYGAMALRHRRAVRNPAIDIERHMRAVQDRLDREFSHREWAGRREHRV
jgi:hypothetical protein